MNRQAVEMGALLTVRQIPVGRMANLVYLLVEPRSREAMVVDSGWETGPIIEAARDLGAKVKYAVATHGHFDHVATLGVVAGKLSARVVAHESSPLAPEVRVKGGDLLRVGGASLKVLHTPGHTEDSICLYSGNEVFTGDTLFVGTIGRFDQGRALKMYRTLYDVVLGLPPGTVLYPGHDYGEVKSRTLGEEKAANPFLSARDFKGFVSLFS